MALDAFIFDVDGTLIDTNALHVEAWHKALNEHGYNVAPDRIGVEVGKGGDQLVFSLLGQGAEKKDGDALRKSHTKIFLALIDGKRLDVFPGARKLLAELRRRGLTVVIATSSKRKELDPVMKGAELNLDELADLVVTADDAAESKPKPDIVTAAVAKAKLFPAQCVMLGDTPYDIDACRDAGVVCFGLECGGYNDEPTLRAAGGRSVYRDPADLLNHLDAALEIASPGENHLTAEVAESLMRQALDAARDATGHGEIPIGCVLARGDGRVVARGFNELNGKKDRTAHAEMVTFAKAAGTVPLDACDLILVSTLEPCVMCTGAAMEAAVDTILYGLKAPADSGTGRVRPPQSPESRMPRIVGNVLAGESRDLFKEWLDSGGHNPQQEQFVKQLLALTKG